MTFFFSSFCFSLLFHSFIWCKKSAVVCYPWVIVGVRSNVCVRCVSFHFLLSFSVRQRGRTTGRHLMLRITRSCHLPSFTTFRQSRCFPTSSTLRPYTSCVLDASSALGILLCRKLINDGHAVRAVVSWMVGGVGCMFLDVGDDCSNKLVGWLVVGLGGFENGIIVFIHPYFILFLYQVYHIDNARDLDNLLSLSLQAQEHVSSCSSSSSCSLDIYEVHPLHEFSYQTPTADCDYVISATMPGVLKTDGANTGRGRGGRGDECVRAMHNLLQSLHESQTVKK